MGDIRAECKTTTQLIYNLKHADLKKIWIEAVSGRGEFPVMQVQFKRAAMETAYNYAVVDYEWVMERVRAEAKNSADPLMVTMNAMVFEHVLAGRVHGVHLSNLKAHHARAAQKGTKWAYGIRFSYEDVDKQYALINWEWFLELRAKEKVDEGPQTGA